MNVLLAMLAAAALLALAVWLLWPGDILPPGTFGEGPP